MIKEISISGYKCLENASIPCNSLTILVGPNASGKSSLLQTILLLRQSADLEGNVKFLRLSGPLYEAGTAQDVLNPAADHKIKIALRENDSWIKSEFSHDRSSELISTSRLLRADTSQKLIPELYDRTNGFSYLNAERLGPRVSYPLPSPETHLGGLVGKQGEYTAAILARASYGTFISPWDDTIARLLSRGPSELDFRDLYEEIKVSEGRLDLVANIMLGWILPGSSFDVSENEYNDIATLRFKRDSTPTSGSARSTHVGFGLSYSLPIITAALALRPGGLLLVENPEAHLHPFSQSRIGIFLAVIAATGRQVFVETHSDHVINGIRLAIKYHLIQKNDFNINFFSRSSSSGSSLVTSILSDQQGRLSRWPEGFFDQIESDLSRL